jgi:hypothetical protein
MTTTKAFILLTAFFLATQQVNCCYVTIKQTVNLLKTEIGRYNENLEKAEAYKDPSVKVEENKADKDASIKTRPTIPLVPLLGLYK